MCGPSRQEVYQYTEKADFVIKEHRRDGRALALVSGDLRSIPVSNQIFDLGQVP